VSRLAGPVGRGDTAIVFSSLTKDEQHFVILWRVCDDGQRQAFIDNVEATLFS